MTELGSKVWSATINKTVDTLLSPVPVPCRSVGFTESLASTEVCPKSPFRAKEFLPGGVHYNLNPRELFRGPYRLNLGAGASLSHRYL
jgi:hypothetical protein